MFKSNKKSELALRTIVVALLLLVVLVVMIMVFTGQMNIGIKALNECESKGNECVAGIDACKNKGGAPLVFLDCEYQDRQTCCKVIG